METWGQNLTEVTYTRLSVEDKTWLRAQRDGEAPTMAAVLRRLVVEARLREARKHGLGQPVR